VFPVDFLQSIPFETIGVAVFALSGALMAARKGMDPFGFALLATLTGVGGGTIRDLLIGTRPVFWVGDPTDVLVCLIVAECVFVLGPKRVAMIEGGRQGRVLLWADALGLALFAVSGTSKALAAGVPALSPLRSGPPRPPSGASSATSSPEPRPWCCARRSMSRPRPSGLRSWSPCRRSVSIPS
jgi:hypothetical protein